MRFRRFAGTIVATAAIVFAAPALGGDVQLEAGTYTQINPATKHIMNPANQIVIVRGKKGRLSFSVNAIRALDLNSGFVVGTFPTNGHHVTWMQKADNGNCKLTFTATAGAMTVVQDPSFGDCGFGYGVLADGTYVRTRSDGPLGKGNGP